ncbi:ATP-binding protein [Mycobacterium spongiae]|uniref:AAA domain-containing protein n=1 Tax=Mycobacterium spongiae TaxID=886343 RepID=A0A975JWG2_9MYCO|nr:AAA family ATPase [Mycobacterium spongiae]QUR66648.1 AAA domain-containing protein [Mycobacterium spongiae]
MIVFPFTAVLGQEELKHCLVVCAIDPGVSGVLAVGDRGTAKTTTVRALGALLERAGAQMPVAELPLGASEDRVLGSLDIDRALRGEVAFAPGILSDAHGGFLYIDEVNLLDDYLVDILLDVAASGVNRVERDGIGYTHPARFVLVGSGNPEEGELRPQLEDRFGLATFVRTIADAQTRLAIVRRRLSFESDPEKFEREWLDVEHRLADRLLAARDGLENVQIPEVVLRQIVDICVESGAVGHRAELVLTRAARATAAFGGRHQVTHTDVALAAIPALRHRTPRQLAETPTAPAARVKLATARVLGLAG